MKNEINEIINHDIYKKPIINEKLQSIRALNNKPATYTKDIEDVKELIHATLNRTFDKSSENSVAIIKKPEDSPILKSAKVSNITKHNEISDLIEKSINK